MQMVGKLGWRTGHELQDLLQSHVNSLLMDLETAVVLCRNLLSASLGSSSSKVRRRQHWSHHRPHESGSLGGTLLRILSMLSQDTVLTSSSSSRQCHSNPDAGRNPEKRKNNQGEKDKKRLRDFCAKPCGTLDNPQAKKRGRSKNKAGKETF